MNCKCVKIQLNVKNEIKLPTNIYMLKSPLMLHNNVKSDGSKTSFYWNKIMLFKAYTGTNERGDGEWSTWSEAPYLQQNNKIKRVKLNTS